MRVFEFIYYCIYSIGVTIKSIDKNKRESLAVELYRIPLFFNASMIIFLIMPFLPRLPEQFNLKILFIFFAVLQFYSVYFLCNYYFIKRKNGVRIVAQYSVNFKNITATIIGALYFILSFIGFVISAKYS